MEFRVQDFEATYSKKLQKSLDTFTQDVARLSEKAQEHHSMNMLNQVEEEDKEATPVNVQFLGGIQVRFDVQGISVGLTHSGARVGEVTLQTGISLSGLYLAREVAELCVLELHGENMNLDYNKYYSHGLIKPWSCKFHYSLMEDHTGTGALTLAGELQALRSSLWTSDIVMLHHIFSDFMDSSNTGATPPQPLEPASSAFRSLFGLVLDPKTAHIVDSLASEYSSLYFNTHELVLAQNVIQCPLIECEIVNGGKLFVFVFFCLLTCLFIYLLTCLFVYLLTFPTMSSHE